MAAGNPVRRGYKSSVGTSYVNCGTVPASTTDVALISVTNRTAGNVKFRGYVAAATWTTGEPTGSDLIASFAYDYTVAPGAVIQISYIIAAAGEQFIVRSDTASALDIFIDVQPYT